MPASDKPKVVRNIKIPTSMTHEQRKSAIVKLQNQTRAKRKQNISDIINDRVKKSGG